jgi:signal transduction histidine kinase
VPAALPTITADADGVSQVLLNLLMNALAALPPGGRIGVALTSAVAPAGDLPPDATEETKAVPGIELRVSDDGPGIDPAILPRVFEPFFSSKPGEGTGLGLTICRDIVRDHGGKIAIDSRPGEGTAVRVWLPVAPSEVSHASAASPHH